MSDKLKLPKSLKSRRPLAWVLGLMFLVSLSFSFICLACYISLSSLWPSGPLGGVIFIDLTFLAFALGGLWWGDSIKGESAATSPLLALTLIAGSIFFLLAPLILPSPPIARIVSPGFNGYFGDRIGLAILTLLPGFFLWGAAPPFLTALAFPQDRGLAEGVFPIFSLTLVAMAFGALFLGFWPSKAFVWPKFLIGSPALPILIIGLWLWAKTPPEDRRELPFWPSSHMGIWTGDKGYGLEILVSQRRAKTLTPALFLGAMAGAAATTVWLVPEPPGIDSFAAPPFILAFLAFGALIFGPLLATLASPMAAISLDLLAMALILAFGPNPPAVEMGDYLAVGGILVALGALWPLAARVSLVRYDFIPSALGHVNIWFLGGILLGLTLTASFLVQYPVLDGFFYRAALTGSFLALSVSISWLWGLVVLLALGFWRLFF